MAGTDYTRFLCRGYTADEQAARNDVVLDRELDFETDTGRVKRGKDDALWADRPYEVLGLGAVDFSGLADRVSMVYDFASSTWTFGTPPVLRSTRAAFATANAVLASGVWALETDTGRTKLGSGAAWNSTPYYGYGVHVLTDAATLALDASLGDNWRVTLGGNRTLANPTNPIDGQVINLRIAQDGTGGRTLSYGSAFKFPGGVAPVLSTAANARDFLSAQYDATNGTWYAVVNKGFA